MVRTLALLLCLQMTGVPAWAQVADEPISVVLHPAALPTPSLKYRLLPDRRDLQPGNAAALYYRSLALFVENEALLKEIKDPRWSEWLKSPLEEMPRKEVREQLQRARHLLHELEYAARCRDCDWNLHDRQEGIGLLLPELSSFRQLGTVLAVKARLRTAEGNFPEAVQTVQTGFALARHLGEAPTLIHVLVGAAVANDMCDRVQELMQQPAAPNLYWSFTVLPRPFVDGRRALDAERDMIERLWPGRQLLEKGVMSAAEVNALKVRLLRCYQDFGLPTPGVGANMAQFLQLSGEHAAAKKALLAQGVPAEQVEAMPVFQAVSLFAFREHRQAHEELAKWADVPNGWHQEGYKKDLRRYQEALGRLDRLFFQGLLKGLSGDKFGLQTVAVSGGRLDRRIAALRCLEAVRLFAAGHDGRLPESLRDVTDVPTPTDPITGLPFSYRADRKTGKATLTAPVPFGGEDNPFPPLGYELALAAKQ